jgi:hypothetical protein
MLPQPASPVDPFAPLTPADDGRDVFAALTRLPGSAAADGACGGTDVSVGRFTGFGLDDQPLVGGLPQLAGKIVPARSTVPLRTDQIGSPAVLVFESGNVLRPIIIGLLENSLPIAAAPLKAVVDGNRLEISAEREIVLRCGEASITLTRAGKVLIQGNYVVSRSTGYNKIKGAAIDIN